MGVSHLASISGSAWKNKVAGEGVLAKVLVVENVGDGLSEDDDGELGLEPVYPGGASLGATKRNAGASSS
jgi:hypothetical protein